MSIYGSSMLDHARYYEPGGGDSTARNGDHGWGGWVALVRGGRSGLALAATPHRNPVVIN